MPNRPELARRGRGVLVADRVVAAPPDVVFAAATDWPRQGAWIPLTRVRVVRGDGRTPGSVVEAFTGIGPVGVLDVLEIVRFAPPHAVDVLHTGRWVRGPGAFTFDAVDGGTRFALREWLHLPGGWAGRVAWALAGPLVTAAARRSLATFARGVER
jgi:voltage-gated potassium channel Kch